MKFVVTASREFKVCWHPGCMNKLSGIDDQGRYTCAKHHNKIDPAIWFFVVIPLGVIIATAAIIAISFA